jgi:hypothetical protein
MIMDDRLNTQAEWFVGLSLNFRDGVQVSNKRFTFVPTPYLESSLTNNVIVMMLMAISPKPTRHVANIWVTSFNKYFVKVA